MAGMGRKLTPAASSPSLVLPLFDFWIGSHPQTLGWKWKTNVRRPFLPVYLDRAYLARRSPFLWRARWPYF
jgi:hypothetical protein